MRKRIVAVLLLAAALLLIFTAVAAQPVESTPIKAQVPPMPVPPALEEAKKQAAKVAVKAETLGKSWCKPSLPNTPFLPGKFDQLIPQMLAEASVPGNTLLGEAVRAASIWKTSQGLAAGRIVVPIGNDIRYGWEPDEWNPDAWPGKSVGSAHYGIETPCNWSQVAELAEKTYSHIWNEWWGPNRIVPWDGYGKRTIDALLILCPTCGPGPAPTSTPTATIRPGRTRTPTPVATPTTTLKPGQPSPTPVPATLTPTPTPPGAPDEPPRPFGVPLPFWALLVYLIAGFLGAILIQNERTGPGGSFLGVAILLFGGGIGMLFILRFLGWITWIGPLF